MAEEQVRMWRARDVDRVLLMAGRTTQYAVDPRDEYVFGIVAAQPMLSRRGSERRIFRPGEIVAWDPSEAHSGTALGGRPWSSRLIVLEAGDLAALADGEDALLAADISFPNPVLRDRRLARAFVELHRAFEAPSSRLERDVRLAEWLRAVVERSPAARTPRSALTPHDDRALRLARDYLGERPERNVSLDELALATGVEKFRLIRLFRERTGLPPHALQLALRVRRARRMLETGSTASETALATGFADQSHLHRHFKRTLGMTPRDYQRRFIA
jgi:AraC-like DNA-binding protein